MNEIWIIRIAEVDEVAGRYCALSTAKYKPGLGEAEMIGAFQAAQPWMDRQDANKSRNKGLDGEGMTQI